MKAKAKKSLNNLTKGLDKKLAEDIVRAVEHFDNKLDLMIAHFGGKLEASKNTKNI